MTAKKLFLFWMLLLCQIICAQQDTIVKLKEVVVSDAHLKSFSKSQSVLVLNDSVIKKNASSLTTLLNYNATVYFKENGFGMVSSPSFRGTTSQQTAVIWNGININSQLNGQTDFNTITTKDYENITVRAGGGSAIYGSSAIGGSIHLNNELTFKNQFQNTFALNYGSFNTFGVHYKGMISNEKVSSNISVSRNSSDNDYEYLGAKGKKNENGQFNNMSMNVGFAYKINAFHFLKMYSQFYESERHFSGTLASVSKGKYEDLNTRNLFEWDGLFNRFTSKLKVAFLSEKYRYFENAATQFFETSRTETLISDYDLGFKWNEKIQLNTILNYTQTKATGMAIQENIRSVGAITFLMKHQILKKLLYELSFRKEATATYKSPFLWAFGTQYDVVKWYQLKLNLSRNFRIPTFNDLYWVGLGNPDLKPESSYQGEIGQRFQFKNGFVSATTYLMKIEDLIQWKPGASGNWHPNNVAEVKSYGVELMLTYEKKVGHHAIVFNSNYAYTVSENDATGKQLTYVPLHKTTTSLSYSYRKLTAYYQYLFTGFVYTSTDNKYFLNEYQVSNVGIDYQLGKTIRYQFGFQMNNVWNENYQSVAQRPMPGRNYNVHLIFKF